MEEHDEQYNNERNKTIPPIPVNSHLHCHSSLDLPNIQDQNIDPKTQKYVLFYDCSYVVLNLYFVLGHYYLS